MITFKPGKKIVQPRSEPPLPPIAQRVANFSRAVELQLAAKRKGIPWHIADEEAERRRAICQGCDHHRPSDDTCAHPQCGCPLKRKARWSQASCPLGHWKWPGPSR